MEGSFLSSRFWAVKRTELDYGGKLQIQSSTRKYLDFYFFYEGMNFEVLISKFGNRPGIQNLCVENAHFDIQSCHCLKTVDQISGEEWSQFRRKY